jgi:hypothetical protein
MFNFVCYLKRRRGGDENAWVTVLQELHKLISA